MLNDNVNVIITGHKTSIVYFFIIDLLKLNSARLIAFVQRPCSNSIHVLLIHPML